MRRIICLILITWSWTSFADNHPGSFSAGPEGPEGNPNGVVSLESLLDAVREGHIRDESVNATRLRRFREERENRAQLLQDIRKERASLELLSTEREASFEANELQISELEQRLQDRMGSLKELFGVMQQVASDTQGQMAVSITQLDGSDRVDFLVDFAGRMGQANRLPAIEEIERLWFELQREMTMSAQIVTETRPVITAAGIEQDLPVTRVGLFNVVADGRYVKFIAETGRLVEYAQQPSSRYLSGPVALATGGTEIFAFALDPVRGQLLDILTLAPDLLERVEQGGPIGYAIMILGVVGVLLALLQLTRLLLEHRRVGRQMDDVEHAREDNALGRVLLVARDEDLCDVDTLELKLGEALLRETPRINTFVPLLKIIAAVAPLMGLLGTVAGMIVTFQAITLFGAGDPKLMASGISQALVTTVLGLAVAIPMLLLHNVVQQRATTLIDVLHQRAVALVAARAEQISQARAA